MIRTPLDQLPPAASLSSSGLVDGLGRRTLAFDREEGVMLERLVVRPELAAFEGLLRDRLDRLSALEDERLARPRTLERGSDGALVVISEFVPGTRLADLLDAAFERGAPLGVDAAIGFLLDVLPALCGLHAGAGFAHGTIAPGRTVLTPAGQVVLLDGIFGGALEYMRYTRRRLWTEFGVAARPTAGAPRLDAASDVAQATLAGLMLVLGRPLCAPEWPVGFGSVLDEAAEVAQIRGSAGFADRLRHFFTRALALSGQAPFAAADDALIALRELAGEIGGMHACRRALVECLEQADRTETAEAPSETRTGELTGPSEGADLLPVELGALDEFTAHLISMDEAPEEALTEDDSLAHWEPPDADGLCLDEGADAQVDLDALVAEEEVYCVDLPSPSSPAGPFAELTPVPDEDPIVVAGGEVYKTPRRAHPPDAAVHDVRESFTADSPAASGVASLPPAEAGPVANVAPATELTPVADEVPIVVAGGEVDETPGPANPPNAAVHEVRESFAAGSVEAPGAAPIPSTEPELAEDVAPSGDVGAQEIPPAPAITLKPPSLEATAPAAAAGGDSLREGDPDAAVRTRRVKRVRSPRSRKDRLRSAASNTPVGAAAPAAAPAPAAAGSWLVRPDRAAAFTTPSDAQPGSPHFRLAPPPVSPPLPPPPAPVAVYPPLPPPALPAVPFAPGAGHAPVPTPAPYAVPGGLWVPPPPVPVPAVAPPAVPAGAAIKMKDSGSRARREQLPPAGLDIYAVPLPSQTRGERPPRLPWRLSAAVAFTILVGAIAGGAYVPSRATPADPARSSDAIASAAAATPPFVPPAAPTGRLEIETQPTGARVLLNGKAAGETPLTIDAIPAGRHTVTFMTASGSVKRTVRVDAGRTVKLDVPIFSGWVGIFAPFVVEVSAGGRVIGTTDEPRLMLSPGRHELTLTNRALGYRAVQSVDIEPGEVRTITLDPRGRANLNATPWAEVWIDGRKVGDTPMANVTLPLGTREVVFRHPDLGERRAAVTVKADATAAVSVDMRK